VIPVDVVLVADTFPEMKRRPRFRQIFFDQRRPVLDEVVVEEVDVGRGMVKPVDDRGGCPLKGAGL